MDTKNSESISDLREALLKSHWPKCNNIADRLAEIGDEEAKNALIASLKSKRHHIRTASIRALASFNDNKVVDLIMPLLDDAAYETRMEAKKILKELTGIEFKTGRNE